MSLPVVTGACGELTLVTGACGELTCSDWSLW